MLSELEHVKLVHRITHQMLDEKCTKMYTQVDNLDVFWSDVKQSVSSTRAAQVFYGSNEHYVLNGNLSALHKTVGLPKAVYDVFLTTANPVAVPMLLDTRAEDQAVSYELFEHLLTAYDRKTEHALWSYNNILCAQISLSKHWTARNINSLHDMVITMSSLDEMWKEAYTHLPEDQLFICPDRLSRFSDSVVSVFPIVHNRCPQNLGKLMNTALEDCLSMKRDWVCERYLEEWSDLWAGLSFKNWQNVKIPDNEYVREFLQPYQDMAQQKHNIENAVQTVATPTVETTRKI